MKKRHLGLIGLASLSLFITLLAPATLLRLILPETGNNISVGHLSGSLWDGSASHIQFDEHRIDKLDWTFLPSRLLLGNVALQVKGQYQQHAVSSVVAVDYTGSLILSDTNATLPASLVGQLAALPMGELAGDITVDLDQARLSKTTAPLADGVVTWKQAAVTVVETARLGEVTIQLASVDDEQLTAKLSNQGGDISLQGGANLAESGDYDASIKLTAGNAASNNVKNSLKMFARKQPDGSYLLDHTGNIFQ